MNTRQTGAAVITAMLVVALAATAASFMMWQNHLWLRQVENLETHAQARWIARAAINWGRAILDDDSRDVDHGGEQWARRLPPVEAAGGMVSGSIVDAQGRFNLNNLVQNGQVSQSDVAVMRRLLSTLQLDPNLTNALVDWMDADDEVTYPGGAEDQRYLALTPPYRAANRPLEDVDELYRVQGFGRAAIDKLRPFVTVLPTATTINVNSAPAEVLMALCEGLQMADARGLVDYRNNGYFKNKTDFRQRLPQEAQVRDEGYGVNSRYFLAVARATQGRAAFSWLALLDRAVGSKTKIVWERPFEE